MKIPTDEDITQMCEEYTGREDYRAYMRHGLAKMFSQLKPLLELVEQLREARKALTSSEPESSFFDSAKDRMLYRDYLKARKSLDKLRDKLELGE